MLPNMSRYVALNFLCLPHAASRGDKEVWNNGLLRSLSWRSEAVTCWVHISWSEILGWYSHHIPSCLNFFRLRKKSSLDHSQVNWMSTAEIHDWLVCWQVMVDDYEALLIPQDIHQFWNCYTDVKTHWNNFESPYFPFFPPFDERWCVAPSVTS